MKTRGDVFLSIREAAMMTVLEEVLSGNVTASEGARRLHCSERKVFRLKAGMKKDGPSGLVHGNRGRYPANRTFDEVRRMIGEHAGGKYAGASCAHMAEPLARCDGIFVSSKTVGRILKESGIEIPQTHRAPKKYRSRSRRERIRDLVQIDASPFDWLETGEMLSLHGAIDDATSTVLSLQLEPHESMNGYFRVLERMLVSWGVPAGIYSDRHTIFFSPIAGKLTEEDELMGRRAPLTQYGTALDLLGIEHIAARTPQAKGRIERLWGTRQSRLVVEMRLRGIRTIDEANAFFPVFLRECNNERFAVAAKDAETAFLPCLKPDILALILATRAERVATAGSEISWEGEKYRLVDSRDRMLPLRRGETITVVRSMMTEDSGIRAIRNGEAYAMELSPSTVSAISRRPNGRFSRSCRSLSFFTIPANAPEPPKNRTAPSPKPHRPADNHPWRQLRKQNAGPAYISKQAGVYDSSHET